MTAYDKNERRAILAGTFFTDAELAARPWLGRTVRDSAPAVPGAPRDPNTRPMTRAERAAVDALVPVCGWCWEPADDRSALGADGYHDECRAAAAGQ